jgi:hypothetical protein
VQQFVAKHAEHVIGTLSGFDRLVFRGTLRALSNRSGLMSYLWAVQVRLTEFAAHAVTLTEQLKDASLSLARQIGRPVQYLTSAASNKEDIARRIAAADCIERGLICVLTAVEPCWSFEIVRDRASRRIEVEPRYRKCLHLYHYQIHPRFGFMSARIQTWLPFRIQICVNGRTWLARSMDAAGLHYVQRDNCFTWLEHPEQAQHLMDQQLRSDWPVLLNDIARSLNPLHEPMFAAFPMEYYWSTYQSEWATDVMFGKAATLAHLYPRLVQHGLTTFLSPDVMRFLGRKAPIYGTIPARLAAEVVSDVKHRPEGVRIKHRVGENSVKMYDNDKPCPRATTRGRAACCGSKPRLMMWRISRHSGRRRTNPTQHRVGSACARGLQTCTGGRRSRRRPTTVTFRRWPRWTTPLHWASLRHGFAGRSATRDGGSGRSIRMRRKIAHCSKRSAAVSSHSTVCATAISAPCSSPSPHAAKPSRSDRLR